ncbi:hypothetical protein BH11PAT1_BH11PAT1_0230 [soil metagenome]
MSIETTPHAPSLKETVVQRARHLLDAFRKKPAEDEAVGRIDKIASLRDPEKLAGLREQLAYLTDQAKTPIDSFGNPMLSPKQYAEQATSIKVGIELAERLQGNPSSPRPKS